MYTCKTEKAFVEICFLHVRTENGTEKKVKRNAY